jgi:hypothetical protein
VRPPVRLSARREPSDDWTMALGRHPLLPAFLCRGRLEAVPRQAAIDRHLIDP